MRHVDLLQTLMVRLVDPEEEEHDWLLIASLFYSLTNLMLPAPRLKHLYYQYLQAHGSRSAMEAACKGFSDQLSDSLQQHIETTAGASIAGIPRCSATGPSTTVRASDSAKAPIGALSGEVRASGTGAPAAVTSVWDENGFCSREASVSQLTPEQLQRWRSLRRELISPDILIDLVQRFALVDGAAVFLAPVVPWTVMEFNGVRSGPYSTVIRRPLSLMCLKRRVLAARRDYELHKHQADIHPPVEQYNGDIGTRKRGRSCGGMTTTGTSATPELPHSCKTNDEGKYAAIMTLQDLEQAVWHVTANCVMFNAPESYYPNMARRFALACVAIIDDYCTQRIVGV